jgi:hypothetical protein
MKKNIFIDRQGDQFTFVIQKNPKLQNVGYHKHGICVFELSAGEMAQIQDQVWQVLMDYEMARNGKDRGTGS